VLIEKFLNSLPLNGLDYGMFALLSTLTRHFLLFE